MLVDPPIDQMVEKVGNKYELVGLLSKRSRSLMENRADFLEANNINPISYAAKEIMEDKIESVQEDA